MSMRTASLTQECHYAIIIAKVVADSAIHLTLGYLCSMLASFHVSLGTRWAIFLDLSEVLVQIMFLASEVQSTLLNMVLPVMSETIELKIMLVLLFLTHSKPQSSPALQIAREGSSADVQRYFPIGSKETPLAPELCALETSRTLKGERTLEDAMESIGFHTQMGALLSKLQLTRNLSSGDQARSMTSSWWCFRIRHLCQFCERGFARSEAKRNEVRFIV